MKYKIVEGSLVEHISCNGISMWFGVCVWKFRCCYRIIMMPMLFEALEKWRKIISFLSLSESTVSVTRLYAYTDRGRRHTTSNLVFLFLATCTRDIHSLQLAYASPLFRSYTQCVHTSNSGAKACAKMTMPSGWCLNALLSRIAALSHSVTVGCSMS